MWVFLRWEPTPELPINRTEAPAHAADECRPQTSRRTAKSARRSCMVLENERVLRLIGLVIVLFYTGIGAVILVGSEGASRAVGLVLVLTGLTWLVIDVLKRRAVI